MKINTIKRFNPVFITIESREELDNFISLVSKIDRDYCHANGSFKLEKSEYEIIRFISDCIEKGL